MTNENKVKANEVKKTIDFECSLVGKVSVDRETLIKNIETEHRSYANFPCSIGKVSKFNLPELQAQYPKGFKLGLVINLPDNSRGEGRNAEAMSL
jgi:hypothetical protein